MPGEFNIEAPQAETQPAGPLRGLSAAATRLRRMLVFGFEQIVLSRLFARHRPLAEGLTAALLKAKAVRVAPPELTVSDGRGKIEAWSRGFSAVNAALYLNLRTPDALSPTRYARPAPAFRAIYLWDTAFIAQIWKWWDPFVAWDLIRSVLRARDGDRLQHFASDFARSELTQPPLIAWSLARLADAAAPARHRRWIEGAFAPLRAYHGWLRANRRLENGLYAWAHAYKSGMENAPRFGDRAERRLRDTARTAAPDFCAYVVLQCEALAAMARTLGEDEEAAALAREADELRTAVNHQLWDEAAGLYFDRDESGDFIRAHTIASLVPLWAGIPDKRRAQRLIDHLLDPGGFNTLVPLPSVAIADPAFERDMWRGPVWANTAFAVIQGLERYGRRRIAAEFAYRLCDGLYRTYARTGRFYEFYDPTAFAIRDLRRKRGNQWKAMTLGKKPVVDFVGWTGLINTLVIETLFGFRLEAGAPVIEPRFPKRAEGRSFALTLPLCDARITLNVGAEGAVRGAARVAGQLRRIDAAFGETVRLDGSRPLVRGAAP